MGSQAQDARHEKILQNCRDAVWELEVKVAKASPVESPQLQEKLAQAKRNLEIQIRIDMERD